MWDINTLSSAFTATVATLAMSGLLLHRIRKPSDEEEWWKWLIILVNIGISFRFASFFTLLSLNVISSDLTRTWLRPTVPVLFLSLTALTFMAFIENRELDYQILRRKRAEILELVRDRLTEEDVRNLCFVLDVDWDNLSGENKNQKFLSLYQHFDKRQDLGPLATALEDLNADIHWRHYLLT